MEDNSQLLQNGKKLYSIEIAFTINTYDIDAAGHVNNIVYIRWLEDLRAKLFLNICDYKKMIEKGFYLVVVATEIKYKKQLKIFDKPIGTIELINHKHGIITLKSLIKLDGEISASAEQKCVIVNLTKNKIIPDKTITQFINSFNY